MIALSSPSLVQWAEYANTPMSFFQSDEWMMLDLFQPPIIPISVRSHTASQLCEPFDMYQTGF